MKRAVIIHCWEGYPNYCWYQNTKKELEEMGYSVEVPEFPDTVNPNLSTWLPLLQETIGIPDEELVLIGHSIGAVLLLRYLESLSEDQKVNAVVLVAGFTTDLNYQELKNFFTVPLDFTKIRQKANHFIAIHSDNDPYVDLKYGDEFKEKLGAKLIVKHAMNHFSGPVDDEASCTNLPDVIESIKEL